MSTLEGEEEEEEAHYLPKAKRPAKMQKSSVQNQFDEDEFSVNSEEEEDTLRGRGRKKKLAQNFASSLPFDPYSMAAQQYTMWPQLSGVDSLNYNMPQIPPSPPNWGQNPSSFPPFYASSYPPQQQDNSIIWAYYYYGYAMGQYHMAQMMKQHKLDS